MQISGTLTFALAKSAKDTLGDVVPRLVEAVPPHGP
jgi:hypothetical protein